MERHTASTITDDELDKLYLELETLRAEIWSLIWEMNPHDD